MKCVCDMDIVIGCFSQTLYFVFFGNRCVYEIYFAVGRHVKVRLAPHISFNDLYHGSTEKDICVNQAKNRVTSKEAHCGAPGTPTNDDEITIRKVINTLGNGFKPVDETVE